MLPSGALSIGPVKVADAGRYRCIAENSEGMVEADAIITVKGMYIHGRVLGWEGAAVGGCWGGRSYKLCTVACTVAWNICVL